MTAALHADASPPSAWVGPRRSLPAVGLIGVCAAAALTELSADEGQVFCPYRLATGGWCPGCGGTRALKHLVRGDIAESLAMNPWTAVVFVQALALSVGLLAKPSTVVGWLRRNSAAVAMFNLVAGLGFWAARIGLGVIPLPFG